MVTRTGNGRPKNVIRVVIGGPTAGAEGWRVEFGHNSHELVTRILSVALDRLLDAAPAPPVLDAHA